MILETDASNYILLGILSQKHAENGKTVLHPIAFMLEKISPTICNYEIGDKKLLTIIIALEKWHIYLYALLQPFLVLTDYYNLQNFMSKALLS